jgi:predicted DNA-binding antitoxin AbrB/MazE fold protein
MAQKNQDFLAKISRCRGHSIQAAAARTLSSSYSQSAGGGGNITVSRSLRIRYSKAGLSIFGLWRIGSLMTITVAATYENGTLKLDRPLPLKDHERVTVSVQTEPVTMTQAYGIMGWKGDHATLERFALDPALDPQENP